MTIQPTLEIHPHQEFHFAPDTDSYGCCCCFKSKTKKKEFIINKDDVFVPRKNCHYRERIEANHRLARILKLKLTLTPIDQDNAFERLKSKINEDFDSPNPITSDRLVKIIKAIYELRKEYQDSQSSEACSEAPQESESSKNLSEQ